MQQHLRVKHKKTDIHTYSLPLKDQRPNMENSNTPGSKRKPSEVEETAAKKARVVSNFLLFDNTVYVHTNLSVTF